MKKIIISLILILGIQFSFAQTFTYDALGRVTGITYPNNMSISYAYNAVGNRTSKVLVNFTPLSVIYSGTIQAKGIENTYIKVLWATQSEINNAHFELEKSQNGVDFEKIGEVAGAINSNTLQSYHFDDKAVALETRYYYRIKQVDVDGKFAYSEIAEAMLTANTNSHLISLYPNPASTDFAINLYAAQTGTLQVRIFNELGQVVAKKEFPCEAGKAQTYNVETTNLSKGAYLVKILLEGESVANEKLLIQ